MEKPVVLISPLDWGLGHATRCVPVARHLLFTNCRVFIAGSQKIISFYKNEFGDEIGYVHFSGMEIKYEKNTFIKLLMLAPGFFIYSIKEHFFLKKIIKETGAQVVISDNRYGLFSKKVYSVFVTHQLNVLLPSLFFIFQKPIRFLIKKVIGRYDCLWVPDYNNGNHFAGELTKGSKKIHPNCFYTGLLTRFANTKSNNIFYDRAGVDEPYILCALSGPEPQRTYFENCILNQQKHGSCKLIILRGIVKGKSIIKQGNCIIYDHVDSNHFACLINNAELIICRSGYSTLMDISAFGGKALLVPTPGQPEQEYLAKLFKKRNWCYYVEQDKFNLKTDTEVALTYDGIPKQEHEDKKLDIAINNLLRNINKNCRTT